MFECQWEGEGGRELLISHDSFRDVVVAVHFAAKETVMEQYSLTLGAHLLLWGFPLSLVILVVAESLLDSRRGGKG
jgi:hypothetical protein